MKSVIFRVHDFLHQLWGLPHPENFSEEEFYYFKRAQMCGEMAVLTLTEFVYCKWLYSAYPEASRFLLERNALQMLQGPLAGKSTLEIALRLDELLHKKIRPRWVREHRYSMAFCDDYVPMLGKRSSADRPELGSNAGSRLESRDGAKSALRPKPHRSGTHHLDDQRLRTSPEQQL